MKKYLSAVLIATLSVGFISSGALKATADVIERGFVSVYTTANTELPPDIVEINISVQTEDAKSLQKAAEENKLISDKVYEVLSGMIDKKNGDFVKTSNYNASPIYSYKNDKKNLIKYQASNNVIVHTKNIQDAGKMIDKAISLGATNINDISFSISSYDKQCDELLSLAAKKAYTRAQLLATSAGNQLNGIKNLNGSCSITDSRPQYRMLAKNMVAGASADSSVVESASPIQGGVIKLFANLNASYFVK